MIKVNGYVDYYSTISNDRDVKNTLTEASENTDIGYNSGGMTEEYRLAQKIGQEHYKKMYQENISFSNPEKHIREKYYDKTSPYYIQGMSDRQRQKAANLEKRMLKTNGEVAGAICPWDYSLKDYKGIYTGPEYNLGNNRVASQNREKQYGRNVINQQLFNLFQKNGLMLDADDDYKLRVDPYSYEVSVEGNMDSQKKSLIEKLFNQGSNGKNLWDHIWKSMHNADNEMVNSQINSAKGDHYAVWYHFKNATGYDVREATYKDGKFFMKDGTDLLELFKEKESNAAGYEHYSKLLYKYAANGWNTANDPVLEIGLDKNGLYDIGQEQGYGVKQSSWIKGGNQSIFDVSV